MDAVAIIKALDVIEDRQLCLIPGSEIMMMHPLVLQVGEETFCYGIVVAAQGELSALPGEDSAKPR